MRRDLHNKLGALSLHPPFRMRGVKRSNAWGGPYPWEPVPEQPQCMDRKVVVVRNAVCAPPRDVSRDVSSVLLVDAVQKGGPGSPAGVARFAAVSTCSASQSWMTIMKIQCQFHVIASRLRQGQ
jgi:hypothetical protein